MRKITTKKVSVGFDDDNQLLLDFGDSNGFIPYSKPFENEHDQNSYEKEMKATISRIVRMLSNVS